MAKEPLFNRIFGQAGGGVGGLLGNPAFMIGAGLLGNQQNQMGGALSGLAAAQGYKLSEAKMKKDEEQEARLRELQDMQMAAAKQQQERQQYTQALLTAGSSQNPALLQDPAFQSQLRMKAAAYGDPAMLQAGGLLQVPQEPTKPTSLMQNAQAAGIDLNTAQGQAEFRRMLEAQQQGAMGGPGQYFAGVTVQMPDGSFAQVQPGNRPGMELNTVPLPGAPLTYDASVAASIAAARASGTKQGEKEGTRIANKPETEMTIAEIEAASADGGLIDQSTGSGIGATVDRAAGLIGIAPDGAQAIAKLKPIADRALKMVPRFEGPQSDKDTQSYREAAGQLADATVPREVRKAAAREIVRLMKARQGQFIDASEIPPGSPVLGTSAAQGGTDPKAEINALRVKNGLAPI